MQGRAHVGFTELDGGHTGRLQDTTACAGGSIHLHVVRVDGGVHDDPGATSQLSPWEDVHKHWLRVRHQRIHNVRAKLEHLVEHVSLPAREATPVGKDEQGQAFQLKVPDGLGSLKGGVRVPDLPRLLHLRLLR